MYVQTDDTGRILVSGDDGESIPDSAEFDLPDDFDFSEQGDYRIVDGELVHDPEPPSDTERVATLKAKLIATDYISAKMSDALTACSTPEEVVEVGERFRRQYGSLIDARQGWRDEINRLNG